MSCGPKCNPRPKAGDIHLQIYIMGAIVLLTVLSAVGAFDLSWIGFERVDRTHENIDSTETLFEKFYDRLAEQMYNRTRPNMYVSKADKIGLLNHRDAFIVVWGYSRIEAMSQWGVYLSRGEFRSTVLCMEKVPRNV